MLQQRVLVFHFGNDPVLAVRRSQPLRTLQLAENYKKLSMKLTATLCALHCRGGRLPFETNKRLSLAMFKICVLAESSCQPVQSIKMLQGLPALQRPACIPLPQAHRLRSWKSLQSQTVVRQPVRQRRNRCLVQAAAAGLPSDDPIQVLKLPQNPDSQAIQRQYNKLKRENKGNEAALTRIESAHSALMMRGLSARLKGGVEVAKEVRYADKAQYLPWRPRLHRADQKLLLYHGIAQALLAGWALLLSVTAGTQPVVASAVAGGVANVWKLNQIFPAPTSSTASEDEKKRGLKNILRGCLLGFLATFFGCFLFFTLPDLVASKINRQLPYWFYANEKVLLCLGTTLSNFFMTGFFR